MRSVVVDLVQVVQKPQTQGARIRIYLGPAIETTEQLAEEGPVESLYFSVTLGVGGGAVDEVDAQAGHRRLRVVRDEATAVIEEKRAHQPVAGDGGVQATEKQHGVLARAHHHLQTQAGGVVEQDQGYPAQAADTGPEVLAVGEDHEHAVRVGKAPHVGLGQLAPAGHGQAQTTAGAPHAGAVDGLVLRHHTLEPGPTEQLGQRRVALVLVLLDQAQEIQELPRQHRRVGDDQSLLGLETRVALRGEGPQPAVERALRELARPARLLHVRQGQDLADGGRRLLASEYTGADLRDHVVSEQALFGQNDVCACPRLPARCALVHDAKGIRRTGAGGEAFSLMLRAGCEPARRGPFRAQGTPGGRSWRPRGRAAPMPRRAGPPVRDVPREPRSPRAARRPTQSPCRARPGWPQRQSPGAPPHGRGRPGPELLSLPPRWPRPP